MAEATIATFANPWHDEIGRFAPKGTGTKFDDVGMDELAVVGERDEDGDIAVEDYTSGQHKTMNAWMRGLGEPRPGDEDLSVRLAAAIERSRGLSRDVLLYRGATRDALSHAEVGDVVEDRGFLSTSTDEYAADIFNEGAVMEIRVPKGTKAILGEENLAEVILQAGTKMRVIEADDGYYVLEVIP